MLTFDDGPWPTTKPVLEALAHHCTKATFFTIGKNAIHLSELLKEVAAGGHTVGVHTWSHANLRKATPEKMKEEIEKGLSAVKIALGNAPAPFFRFPFLQDPHDAVAYLGTRNIAIFSMDLDSFDFKIKKADEVVKSVMTKLEKKGKGIILMHDFQLATSHGIMELLNQLKAKGYKVVHLKPKAPAATIPEFDQAGCRRIQRSHFRGSSDIERRSHGRLTRCQPLLLVDHRPGLALLRCRAEVFARLPSAAYQSPTNNDGRLTDVRSRASNAIICCYGCRNCPAKRSRSRTYVDFPPPCPGRPRSCRSQSVERRTLHRRRLREGRR